MHVSPKRLSLLARTHNIIQQQKAFYVRSDHLSHLRFKQVRVPCGVSVAGFYVIYLQHKGKVVHSEATKAHEAAVAQLPAFLLSAPSRSDANAHWREGPVIPRAHVGVLQTRKSLLPTDIQSTDHPVRSPVIILTYVRVGILLHEVFWPYASQSTATWRRECVVATKRE